MRVNSHQPHERAEALFKKKQEQLREGQQAMAEYQAERHAVREKTARLRALRLARDAAIDQPEGSTGRTSRGPASRGEGQGAAQGQEASKGQDTFGRAGGVTRRSCVA